MYEKKPKMDKNDHKSSKVLSEIVKGVVTLFVGHLAYVGIDKLIKKLK